MNKICNVTPFFYHLNSSYFTYVYIHCYCVCDTALIQAVNYNYIARWIYMNQCIISTFQAFRAQVGQERRDRQQIPFVKLKLHFPKSSIIKTHHLCFE